MSAQPKLGSKVRALRRREGLTQVAARERLGISPSYLNLIEHNRRPLPAHAAHQARAGLSASTSGVRRRLRRAGSPRTSARSSRDPLFEEHGVTTADVRDWPRAPPAGAARSSPCSARTVVTCSRCGSWPSQLYDGRGVPRRRSRPSPHRRGLRLHPGATSTTSRSSRSAAEELARDARLDRSDMYRLDRRAPRETHGVKVVLRPGRPRRRHASRRYDPRPATSLPLRDAPAVEPPLPGSRTSSGCSRRRPRSTPSSSDSRKNLNTPESRDALPGWRWPTTSPARAHAVRRLLPEPAEEVRYDIELLGNTASAPASSRSATG